jgi:hypothetical protein
MEAGPALMHPCMTLGRPLVSPGIPGCQVPVDPGQRMAPERCPATPPEGEGRSTHLVRNE